MTGNVDFYVYRVVYKYLEQVFCETQVFRTSDTEEAKARFLRVLPERYRPGIEFVEFEQMGLWGEGRKTTIVYSQTIDLADAWRAK